MTKQKQQTNKKELGKGIALLGALLYIAGISIALLSTRNGNSLINALLVFGLYLPTVLLVAGVLIGYVCVAWWKFWLWVVPNWIAYVINIPKWQAAWLYTFLLLSVDVMVSISLSFLLASQALLYVLVIIGAASILSIARVVVLFDRRARYHVIGLVDLRARVSKQYLRSEAYAHMNRKQATKAYHYDRFARKNTELPNNVSVLQNSLYGCMESYTALQQGADTEDPHLSQALRAGLMAQFLSLKASGFKHFFILKDMELTHIGTAPKGTRTAETANDTYYAAYVTAQLYETLTPSHEKPPSEIRPVKTPFYIVFSFINDDIQVQTIQLEESRIESNQIRQELIDFANDKGLLYIPQLAPALIPNTGLLTTKGALRRWSIASNFMAGHTNSHAFSLFSIQPYLRLKNVGSYIVGSTVIQKTYDRIIVADKHSDLYERAAQLPIQRISTESSDFSARFGIFIGQESTIPSLELLNPGFIEQLLACKVSLTLEVIDSHIYFYLPSNQISQADFSAVLLLMQAAHKELRL